MLCVSAAGQDRRVRSTRSAGLWRTGLGRLRSPQQQQAVTDHQCVHTKNLAVSWSTSSSSPSALQMALQASCVCGK